VKFKIDEGEIKQQKDANSWLHTPLIFSARGFSLAILALLLFIGPATQESDIIASVLSFAFAAVLILLPVLTVAQGLRLKKTLSATLVAPDGSRSSLIASRPSELLLNVSGVSLLPFYSLRIELSFNSPNVAGPEHRLLGGSPVSRKLPHSAIFPHRGIWTVKEFSIRLEDKLGLSYLSWILPTQEQQHFSVAPAPATPQHLPPLSSSERPGDLLSDSKQKLGDPFDLKRYHPSDGIRKVAWKIFARTGELITRHPEPSMTPEGLHVVYIVCDPEDDYCASVALHHSRRIEDLGLRIIAGCDGALEIPTAHSSNAIEEMLIRSVWNSELKQKSFNAFIDRVKVELGQSQLSSVLVLVPQGSMGQQHIVEHAQHIGTQLEQLSAKPVFAIIKNSEVESINSDIPDNVINSWFLQTTNKNKPHQAAHPNVITQLCSSRSWELIS
jgi:hypothetical protein